MTKKIVTLAVCVVLMAGLLIVYAVSKNAKERKEADASTPTPEATVAPKLVTGTLDDIVKFTLKGADYEISLVKDGEGIWDYEDVKGLSLIQSDVSSVARYLTSLTAQLSVTDKAEDLAEYGLSNPAVTVTALFADGTSATVLVGDLTTEGDRNYAKTADSDAVYAISSYVGDTLFKKTYKDFANTAPPEFGYSEIRELVFKNGEKSEMRGKYAEPDVDVSSLSYLASNIILETPIAGKAVYLENFATYVVENVYNINYAELVKFIGDGDIASYTGYGFENPNIELYLKGVTLDEAGAENGTFEYRLLVGAKDGDFYYAYVGGTGCIFKAAADSLAPLFSANIYKMMDKFINIIYINNVETIDITGPLAGGGYFSEVGGYKDYSSSEEGYDEIAPKINGTETNDAAFRKFYQLLIALAVDSEIEGFVITGEPELTVVFTRVDGVDIKTEYYRYDDNFLAVAQNGRADFVISRKNVARMLSGLKQVAEGALEITE